MTKEVLSPEVFGFRIRKGELAGFAASIAVDEETAAAVGEID
jgi:hypothetical protein